MQDLLDLWDYRRRVHEIYRAVRSDPNPQTARQRWITERDRLFREHPQSALPEDGRASFQGIPYFPYDPAWRLTASVEALSSDETEISHSGAGSTLFRRFGVVDLETPAGPAKLTLFWLESYSGGVFLPFRDTTNRDTTYGGGRYLLDTAKGADLGHEGDQVVLDFNFAYHPSCVYDYRWSCPLAPPENHLDIPIEAGERLG